jgi:putative peptidoglycan lipid II flippase
MPHGGLALANSLATMLEMGALLFIMRNRLQGLEGRRILIVFAKAALAVLIMAFVLVIWINQAINQPTWLLVIVGISVGAGVYGITILILGVEEARNLLNSAVHLVRQKIGAI